MKVKEGTDQRMESKEYMNTFRLGAKCSQCVTLYVLELIEIFLLTAVAD